MVIAEDLLKQWPVSQLVRASSGGIDLNEMAHYELAERGHDKYGNDVGLEKAMDDWRLTWGGK